MFEIIIARLETCQFSQIKAIIGCLAYLLKSLFNALFKSFLNYL